MRTDTPSIGGSSPSRAATIPLVDTTSPVDIDGFAPVDLYKRREKIFTRHVTGHFQRIRLYSGWPLLVAYFVTPWLHWGDRQAVLFDLASRKFYVFSLTLWPQDFMLLAGLLIIAAFGLFTVTSVVGRVWCGYTCPQTVWTAIFMWVEQITEGSRHARMNLDAAPWSVEKVRKRALKHAVWLGCAFLTGLTFVGYFTPIRDLAIDFIRLDVAPGPLFWTLAFTGATYGNAGWLREQVCIYMCPYARFQSAMFDRDTLIVSYDRERGEPRGSRKRGEAVARDHLGDCIDCRLCVQVCPTGIDIRDGLQYQCIGCAHCIDACDQVMDKMGYPRGLVRYTTESALVGAKQSVLRPRVVGYAAALALMAALFGWALLGRELLSVDVSRDRGELYQRNGDRIRNDYSLTLLNKTEAPVEVSLRAVAVGAPTLTWHGAQNVVLRAGEVANVPFRLEANATDLRAPRLDVDVVACTAAQVCARERSRFFGPPPS